VTLNQAVEFVQNRRNFFPGQAGILGNGIEDLGLCVLFLDCGGVLGGCFLSGSFFLRPYLGLS
jgi:hypothetical protein